jgi:hypothetical protein
MAVVVTFLWTVLGAKFSLKPTRTKQKLQNNLQGFLKHTAQSKYLVFKPDIMKVGDPQCR